MDKELYLVFRGNFSYKITQLTERVLASQSVVPHPPLHGILEHFKCASRQTLRENHKGKLSKYQQT